MRKPYKGKREMRSLSESGIKPDDDGIYFSVSTIMFGLFPETECSEEMTAQLCKMVAKSVPLE